VEADKKNRYGYSNEIWDAARAEIKDKLEDRVRSATKRSDIVTFYSDLARSLTSIVIDYGQGAFAQLLCDVSRETDADYGVMLSVVVIGKCNSVSGPGFFRIARKELGRTEKDDIVLWSQEFLKVLKHYRKQV